jgi:hypothetical protein
VLRGVQRARRLFGLGAGGGGGGVGPFPTVTLVANSAAV